MVTAHDFAVNVSIQMHPLQSLSCSMYYFTFKEITGFICTDDSNTKDKPEANLLLRVADRLSF